MESHLVLNTSRPADGVAVHTGAIPVKHWSGGGNEPILIGSIMLSTMFLAEGRVTASIIRLPPRPPSSITSLPGMKGKTGA